MEGYSNAVVILLTQHWTYVGELVTLTWHDQTFLNFIVAHIDTLMSPNEAKIIVENSRKHCPPEDRTICSLFEKKALNPG